MTRTKATRIGLGVVCVVGLTLLAWHASTLRLEAEGRSFVWPVLAAFGLGWVGRREAMWRSGAAMAVGSLAGVAAVYLAVMWLPLTASGSAVALGAGLALVAIVAWAARGWLSFGSSIAAYGLGVGAAQMVGVDASSTAVQAGAAWTTVVLALLLGLVAAEAVAAAMDRAEREEEIALPEPLPLLTEETERIRAGRRRAS